MQTPDSHDSQQECKEQNFICRTQQTLAQAVWDSCKQRGKPALVLRQTSFPKTSQGVLQLPFLLFHSSLSLCEKLIVLFIKMRTRKRKWMVFVNLFWDKQSQMIWFQNCDGHNKLRFKESVAPISCGSYANTNYRINLHKIVHCCSNVNTPVYSQSRHIKLIFNSYSMFN